MSFLPGKIVPYSVLKILVYCMWLVYMPVQAQDTVRIQIDGMTCSLCSRNVQQQIQQLQFVKKVWLQLNTNVAEVIVDTSRSVSIEALAKAVYNAGFTVGKFLVPIPPNPRYSGIYSYQYISIQPPSGQFMTTGYYTLVGKAYMNQEAYKKVKRALKGMHYIPPVNNEKILYYQ